MMRIICLLVTRSKETTQKKEIKSKFTSVVNTALLPVADAAAVDECDVCDAPAQQ
jgi:hypothetical protein